MYKAKFRASFLAIFALTLFSPLLNATYILKNDLLKFEATQLIDTIGTELVAKTGVHIYMIATNEHFEEGFNLVEYSQGYEANLSTPYVLYIFAPYATITQKAKARGRVGIIPSSPLVRELYDYDEVRDAGIDIVAIKDSNTEEDKFNIGMLQAYSVLADNIALAKGIELDTTIRDEMGQMVLILRILVYSGTAVLLLIFVLRPLWIRRKNAREKD